MARKIQIKPRKTASQQRSAGTIEIILQAAARVLERESLSGFNTNRIAEVAGVSVGSIYQYFPNKDALMAALILRNQQWLSDTITDLIEKTREIPLQESIATLAKFAVNQQFTKPILSAALDHEERRLPIEKILATTEAKLIGAIEGLLHRHKKELPRDLPKLAALDCINLTKALTDSASKIDKANNIDLEQRIIRTLMGYLFFEKK